MKTKAVRLYGRNDLRLEEFELPQTGDDEILARIVSDSICMSSYKAAIQGSAHKRVPKDVDRNPVIIGHEFCGEIIEVGKKWSQKFQPGDRFSIQPALNRKDNPYETPGYSFAYIGGAATYIVIPDAVMEAGCLLPYSGDAFFLGSLAEPISCIAGAFHASYHTVQGSYVHDMGIVEGGSLALLAAAGPMGLGAIDYAVHCDRRPGLVVVTDIDDARLERAASVYTAEEAAKNGVRLVYVNTAAPGRGIEYLRELTGGRGYDDVMVFAPVRSVVETGDGILARDGCLNFFAGPNNPEFSANLNLYNVHYNATHVVGTSGGNTADMLEALDMMASGRLNSASMVTHVGGLNCVVDTTLNLPQIPGGKKLIYTNVDLELTAISDFESKKDDPLFAGLSEIVGRNNGLWNAEAEKFLLANAKKI